MKTDRLALAGSFCWNRDCPGYGKVDHGNIVRYGRTDKGTQRFVFAGPNLTPHADPILTPQFKLTNPFVNKAHVSLPSPKTLSVHVQDQCMMGNPI